jgi:hypothetical protein
MLFCGNLIDFILLYFFGQCSRSQTAELNFLSAARCLVSNFCDLVNLCLTVY